jgi:ribonucleoside-diphosphate reductase beta chain
LDDWRKLTAEEKDLVGKVFGGLTLLDTLQSETGVQALRNDIRTPHEEAVYNNIQFMESVHAKSYSSIFSTLNTKTEIEEIFEWTDSNEFLQRKAKIINEIYENGTALEKKVASVFLETFLFYSGFFTPLYYLGNNKLANVAEIIKLIIRDESVHGTYIGYKFQLGFNELSDEEQDKLRDWMYDLLYQLYENEEDYTRSLYDAVGWTEEVLTFLRYNANKALMNLGQDPLFPDSADDVNPIIMNGISTGTSNHDFFSQVGNGYLLGEVEAMTDDDYLYGL